MTIKSRACPSERFSRPPASHPLVRARKTRSREHNQLPLVDVVLTTFGSAAEILFATMMEEAPEYYVFTGEVVPDHVTHVIIDEALKFVRARAFEHHPNIEEVICHYGVEKIEKWAFNRCPRLRRVIMPGVKEVEKRAFGVCEALTYVEWGRLERIGEDAFYHCNRLSSVDLPSIRIVGGGAFDGCWGLVSAKFGKDLESFGGGVFSNCRSRLERIALPLKDGMITADDLFQYCPNLNHVDLVGGVHETIDALLLDEWKNDMNEEINSISQILPNTPAGNFVNAGEKAQEIRAWIRSVLHKIVHYKAQHRRHLDAAASALHSALPNDIILKNVLPFVELPSHTFDGED